MDIKVNVLDIAPDVPRTEEEFNVQSTVSFTSPYPSLNDKEKSVYASNLAGYKQIIVLADCLKLIDNAVATNNVKLVVDLFKKLNDVDIISDILGYAYNRISLEIDKIAYLNINTLKSIISDTDTEEAVTANKAESKGTATDEPKEEMK